MLRGCPNESAGDRSAIIYTAIESCRRRALDPYAYLKDVLTRLPQMTIQRVPEVLPAAWGKPQPLRKASQISEVNHL